jgi:hypothetical protein
MGTKYGKSVRIAVEPGQIMIEHNEEPILERMLAVFDPVRHGGEVMAFSPVGVELLHKNERGLAKRIAILSKELTSEHLAFNTSLEGTFADGFD